MRHKSAAGGSDSIANEPGQTGATRSCYSLIIRGSAPQPSYFSFCQTAVGGSVGLGENLEIVVPDPAVVTSFSWGMEQLQLASIVTNSLKLGRARREKSIDPSLHCQSAACSLTSPPTRNTKVEEEGATRFHIHVRVQQQQQLCVLLCTSR